MSYPKEECIVRECPYNKKDPNYTLPVCEYPYDIEEALEDADIPTSCPWLEKAGR